MDEEMRRRWMWYEYNFVKGALSPLRARNTTLSTNQIRDALDRNVYIFCGFIFLGKHHDICTMRLQQTTCRI